MLRQIIVFTRDKNLPSCKEFALAAKKHQLSCLFFNPFDVPYQEFLLAIEPQEVLTLPRTSGILFDDLDLTLLEDLIARGATSTHSPNSIALLRDKDQQYFYLERLGLKCVPTLIHRGKLELKHLESFSSAKLWVLKSSRGNKGIGHKLFNGEELLEFWQKTKDKNDQRYLIQPFFSEVEEHRLLVIGKNEFLLRKRPGNSWKKNATTSDFEEVVILESSKKELRSISSRIRESIGLDSFAVDLFVVDKEENYYEILEVNAHPGMKAAQAALGHIDLYDLFLSHYLKN